MKQILSTLMAFIIVLFLGLALYVFEIFPFNPGGPFMENKTPDQTGQIEDIPQVPDFLQESAEGDKVARTKSYTEYMNRGKLLFEQGYHSLAISEYESAYKVSPLNPAPLIQIGIIHFSLKDFVKAKINLQEALKIDPDNLTATIYLGRTLIAERKLDEAKRLFDELTIHNQESKFYQALLTAYQKDHAKAKNLLNEVIGINTNPEISEYARNFLAAYDEFDSSQDGMDIHLTTLLARSCVNAGEYDMAIPMLFEVLRLKKDYRDAWIILGYSYLSQEKFNEAVDALEEARKLDPEKPQTAFFLGMAYYGLNNLEKAVSAFELAKKNGFEPVVQVNQKLAEIYLQMKEYQKSADHFEDVVRLYDQDVYYYVKPIWIYIDRLNQPEKAIALANKAVAAHPDEAMSYNLLGWASISMNRLNDAKTLLDKAHAINPELDAVYLNYGLLMEQQGKPSEALGYYNEAYKLGNGNSISEVAAERYNNIIGKSENINYADLKANTLNQ